VALLAWSSALAALAIGLRIWWERRMQTRVLGPLATLLDAGRTSPAPQARRRSVWVLGSRHGRAVRLGPRSESGEGDPLWRATFDLGCQSGAVFDVGRQDGPESYLAQLPYPVLRAAVRGLVETHRVESVALNASSPPLPPPYRLRVTVDQTTRRPSMPPAAARGILDDAERIARLLEG
jgi:hypothetical protein